MVAGEHFAYFTILRQRRYRHHIIVLPFLKPHCRACAQHAARVACRYFDAREARSSRRLDIIRAADIGLPAALAELYETMPGVRRQERYER